MLATLRLDGFPRISPIEPRAFEHQLWIVGMPGTTKFRDLRRDPRFCLHTATIDTEVTDGDAKVWGVVDDIQDKPYSNGLPRHCSRTPGLTFGDWTSTTSMLPT